MVQTVKAEQARLLLMGAQGLLDDPARAATPASLRKLVTRMGFVQLDSINFVERAHHLTLLSRSDGYRREHLARLLERDRALFEHWTHDASAIPVEWFAHWKPRFERAGARIRASLWWRERMGERPERVVAAVRERVEREGPLRSQDFEHEGPREGSSAWWGWKPQKAALEYLWRTGELSVARRESFQKVYDLTERVFPEQHRAERPSTIEHVEWACSTAIERLAVATPKELADFWASIEPAQAKTWCERAARAGRVVPVNVEAHDSLKGGKPRAAYAVPDWERRLKNLPEPPRRTRLLSPFDPVLRDRARLGRLFGFDYRFEAFVPEPARRFGYYVLPVLEGDRLVGRIDPKLHRDEGVLRVRRVFWEPDVRVTRARRKGLEEAAERLARFAGAERVEWPADSDG
ncbi:MAG TPA: crosslink repair DNA glycosylase YcaQ family protein [Pyrinomonadaceae bacterium]|nr:crosslink repair DNA glycosylase YcaQ family protein [Pyrinomonadaceae bacterium]